MHLLQLDACPTLQCKPSSQSVHKRRQLVYSSPTRPTCPALARSCPALVHSSLRHVSRPSRPAPGCAAARCTPWPCRLGPACSPLQPPAAATWPSSVAGRCEHSCRAASNARSALPLPCPPPTACRPLVDPVLPVTLQPLLPTPPPLLLFSPPDSARSGPVGAAAAAGGAACAGRGAGGHGARRARDDVLSAGHGARQRRELRRRGGAHTGGAAAGGARRALRRAAAHSERGQGEWQADC